MVRVVVGGGACGGGGGAPPNYVGRIRSNLSFEVILRSKKVKNAKTLNFFGQFLGEEKVFENPL